MKRFLTGCGKLANYTSTYGTVRVGEGLSLNYTFTPNPSYPTTPPCLNGFIVEPNAKLTLGSDFHFNTNAKIHVKAKGRLYLEGMTLSGCVGGEWVGIEVDGNPSLGQIPTTNQEEQDLNSDFNTTKSTYLSLLAQYNALPPGSALAIALAPQLTTHRSTMHRIANRIIRSEVSDTVGLDLPKIRTWLRNKASKEADYAIVDTWLLEGDTTRANEVLDSIPIVHGLTANDEVHHAVFKAWVALLNQFASEEKDIYDLSANDVALVASIADGAQGMAAARAQGLLNALYGTDYRLSPKTPQAGGGGGGMLLKLPADNGFDIKAYPNPANHTVQFDYHVPEDAPATLLVFDADGRRVEQATLAAGRGKAKLDTKAWRPGIYYYKVSCGQSTDFAPKKLVIIH